MRDNIANPTTKDLRNFALIMAGMIGLIFGLLLPWRFEYTFPLWPWIVLVVLTGAGLLVPKTLILPYKGWMRFGLVMNAIMSRLILGVVYYLAVVPTGLILRMLKKDPMCKTFDKDLDTYWIPVSSKPAEQMRKPF